MSKQCDAFLYGGINKPEGERCISLAMWGRDDKVRGNYCFYHYKMICGYLNPVQSTYYFPRDGETIVHPPKKSTSKVFVPSYMDKKRSSQASDDSPNQPNYADFGMSDLIIK